MTYLITGGTGLIGSRIVRDLVRDGEQAWKYDTRPIEEEIGYKPQWSMKSGIKETINIVRREHGLTDV